MMRKGVPAVVAMQYEVPDEVSIKFADAFYRALVSPDHTGECWYALNRARQTVRNNQKSSTCRGFVTPVLYLAAGNEKLFDLDVIHQSPEPVAVVPKQKINLPKHLIDAYTNGRCVPVVGSGVLRAGAMRLDTVPGPLELAEILAQESEYPNKDADFSLAKSAGEWMETSLLQWVSQHYLYSAKVQPYRLFERVRELYSGVALPPGLKQLASWKVPGIFYCQCDGLMEEALADRNVAVLNQLTHDAPTGSDGMLLVNLRGSWTDNSLVLTEQDHDKLWNDLQQMHTHVRELIDKVLGRSLLIVGVHPRDPLVRQLCMHMLTETNARTRGDIFFVCPEHSAVDEAYWARFRTHWISMEVEDFIAQVTALV